jgi:hypothetical protein
VLAQEQLNLLFKVTRMHVYIYIYSQACTGI